MKKIILISALLAGMFWNKAAAQVSVHVRVGPPPPRVVMVRPAPVVVRPVPRRVVVVRPAPVVAVVHAPRVVRVYRY